MKSKWRIIGLLGLSGLMVLSLANCSSSGDDAPPAIQPIAYVGNTDPADITLANTPALLVNVLYGGSTTSSLPIAVSISVDEAQAGNVALAAEGLLSLIHYSVDDLFGNAASGYNLPLALVINDTLNCDSGYITLKGTVDDFTGSGTVAFSYVNCVLREVTYNGSGNMHIGYIYEYDANITFDFTLLTISGPYYRGSMSGSVTIDDSLYGDQFIETDTMNYVTQDDVINKMHKFENYVYSHTTNDYFSSYRSGSETYNGTVYDSIHGGVTVATVLPLSYIYYTNTYADDGGPLTFTGNQSSAILTVMSGKHVMLELDLDGDGNYEVDRYVLWREIDDYASLDLGDTDIDGMHNSWESMSGLDPEHDDAGDDPDTDTYTNLEEYEGGSDPQNPISIPFIT